MGQAIDITGVRSGRLVAIRYAGYSQDKCRMWLCECDCGKETIVKATAIKCGYIRSCGCAAKEASSNHCTKINTKHGMHNHPLYIKWKGMRRRCLSKKDKSYSRYGGRGITICEEWSDFKAFHDWSIENGWKPGLTIDRIDNNRGYYPDNCRFTTGTEQVRNRRKTVFLEYNGEKKALTEWCEILGLNKKTIYGRLHYRGWTNPKEILFGKEK